MIFEVELKKMINRPEKDEFAPYYLPYVNSVPEGDIISILTKQLEDTKLLLKEVTEEQGTFRYAPGKWSIKEVVGHMTDTERIMAYRLMSIARGETVSLPGFDESLYVANSSFNDQSFEQLLEHFSVVRESTLVLLQSLNADAWLRTGLANNTGVSVRGVAYIIAGHAMHHCKIIKERYLESKDFPK
jgi:hypothetical protein